MRLPALLALHVVALAFGTYTAFRVTLDSGFERMQTDPGDTVLNHYLLEHTWRAISDSRYPHALWSPPFYYPTPKVLSYSENMLGVAPVYWLLRTMLPSDLAFQAWMMVLCALNYLAMAAVLHRVKLRHDEQLPVILIALGAFLWAFGLPQQAQLNHQQLIARFWMPIAMALAWQFVLAPSARILNRILLVLFLQILTCINTGWFLAFGLGVFVPFGVWLNGTGPELRHFLRHHAMWVLTVFGFWGTVLVLFMLPYIQVNADHPRVYEECVEHLPMLDSFVAGPPESRWFHTIRPFRAAVGHEAYWFSGFAFYFVLLAAVVAVRIRRREFELHPGTRLAIAGFLASIVLILLTLNYGSGVSPWWLVRFVPGGLAIRAVGRVQLAIFLLLIPAVLVGFTLWVQSRLRDHRARQFVFALAAGIVVFEQTGYHGPSFDKPDVYERAARIAKLLAGADVGYVVLPAEGKPMEPSLVAMWAGMLADVPMVNGYSGRQPNDLRAWDPLTDEEVRTWLGPACRGKTLVIVDVTATPGAVRRYVVD